MIEIENLTKKYGDHVAVDHLSFRIDRGMIYGFLGPNGAGKSTTMNIMTGYIAATEGTVKINGYDILKEPEKAKKSIGYLPEIPPVYPDMTVYEYLKFVAELKKVPREERKEQIEDIMEQTRVYDVKDRLIKNLSKGYKQRVGLAQAIIGYPEVIILDEPTVGLDPKQIIEIRELIKELARKHTVILSSHILSEVSAVCDHIMIISKGKLVASDTPEGLMAMMKGGRQLMLSVKGRKESLEAVLKECPQITDYRFEEAKEEGCIFTTLSIEGEEDIREKLFYRLCEEKMPIMELVPAERTLEDVFLELTGEEKKEEEQNKESGLEEAETESKEEDKKDEGDI
ncbi:MAG: ABC transporter ATP-binding protein [Lachnospiraceae bacterium]|nr:ABC transporter ATP-binding protein [Lachnospiraceae bacterium]